MTRTLTPDEQLLYGHLFPNLKVGRTLVTAEATPRYNCIAWSVGITHQWLWPGDTYWDFEDMYLTFGYRPAESGSVSLWGHSTYQMTHACVQWAQEEAQWESKCGAGLRMVHGLEELEGESYGRHWKFFRRDVNLWEIEEDMKEALEMTTFTPSPLQIRLLDAKISGIPVALQSQFHLRFNAWKATWFAGMMAFDSNPNSRARGPAFEALEALGPEVLPLVVREMLDPDQFFAVLLYQRLTRPQIEPGMMGEPDTPSLPYGFPPSEQQKAQEAIRQFLASL